MVYSNTHDQQDKHSNLYNVYKSLTFKTEKEYQNVIVDIVYINSKNVTCTYIRCTLYLR